MSVAATAGGRMGDAIGEEALCETSALHPARRRMPLDAMTAPGRLALEACAPESSRDPPLAPAAVPLPRCTTGHPATRRAIARRRGLGPARPSSTTGAARSSGAWLALRAGCDARRPVAAPGASTKSTNTQNIAHRSAPSTQDPAPRTHFSKSLGPPNVCEQTRTNYRGFHERRPSQPGKIEN